ncbi:hypothetical protein EJ04DRAFT_579122 [Polyplosphaeria fusca]|uniref:Uncharacterized protein n=1 Tax=Polyplosphaeria fusca TaxID=682080 RepID=A0A9P4QRN7_9PLEO|nr:hypothetical protein EJ04DRAFT_579122 [Polyplosphaeria fusca]
MTVFVTFTMGAKEAYFFNSPTHWAWRNLPPDVEALFTKTPPIKDVLELSLGEHGTYFVSFRDSDGQIYCRHYNLPNPLTEYLYHSHPSIIRDLTTLSVALGPYESYYAYDKSSASWSNLPPNLEKAVLNRLETQDAWKTVWKDQGREAPSFVSLGADGAYFMRTVGGGGSWELKSKEEGMQGTNKFLEGARDFSGVAGLYLFPTHPDSYILLLTSGKAFSNLPEHTWPDYSKMADKLPATVQTSLPVPPSPVIRQPQPQQQLLQPSMAPQHNHHSPTSPLSPQNCCPQAPGYASPFPPPYNTLMQPQPQLRAYAASPVWPNPNPNTAPTQYQQQGAVYNGQTTGVVSAQSTGQSSGGGGVMTPQSTGSGGFGGGMR